MSFRPGIRSIVAITALAALAQCRSPATPNRTDAVFVVRACRGSLSSPDGEIFRILLRDGRRIAQARSLVGAGNRKIVIGRLAAGDGGFNAPWSWHLDTETIEFADVTIEICDGCPSAVEANGGRWGLGSFCPWSSEIIAEQ